MKKHLNSTLIKQIEEIADKKYDGHYTIYRFTTHYKGVFGTLMEQGKGNTIRDQLNTLPSFLTLEELLYWMVEYETKFNAYK